MQLETIREAAARLQEHGFSDADRMRLGGAIAAAKGLHANLLSPVLWRRFNHVLLEYLHAQYWRELELVGLLQRVTPWRGDIAVAYDLGLWNTNLSVLVATFALRPTVEQQPPRAVFGTLAIGHALLAELRPVPLIPLDTPLDDPFFSALKRVEGEAARMIQVQMRLLRDAPIDLPLSDKEEIVEAAERQVEGLFADLVNSLAARP